MIGLLLILASYALVFVFSELLHRRTRTPVDTRKIAHISGGIISAFLPLAVSLPVALGIGIASTLLLLFARQRGLLHSIYANNGSSWGPVFFPLGLTIAAALLWPTNRILFQAGALVIGLGDGFAALIGMRFGRHYYRITGKKSFEGSLAFLFITAVILFFALSILHPGMLLQKKVLQVGFGSILLTVFEGALSHGTDNLFIPTAAGFVLLLM